MAAPCERFFVETLNPLNHFLSAPQFPPRLQQWELCPREQPGPAASSRNKSGDVEMGQNIDWLQLSYQYLKNQDIYCKGIHPGVLVTRPKTQYFDI